MILKNEKSEFQFNVMIIPISRIFSHLKFV